MSLSGDTPQDLISASHFHLSILLVTFVSDSSCCEIDMLGSPLVGMVLFFFKPGQLEGGQLLENHACTYS
jgi:hypothetical protein